MALLESLVCLGPTGVWSLVTTDALVLRQPADGDGALGREEVEALMPSEIGESMAAYYDEEDHR